MAMITLQLINAILAIINLVLISAGLWVNVRNHRAFVRYTNAQNARILYLEHLCKELREWRGY